MHIFFDFDSTIIQTESLDKLAEIVYQRDERKLAAFEAITNDGMSGKLDFYQSLLKRIELISSTHRDVNQLISELPNYLSSSIHFLKKITCINPTQSYVVSGGFLDYIKPICIELGFPEKNIFGNEFRMKDDAIVGFDDQNILCRSKGKANLIKSLQLSGPKIMIGDGYTDLEVKLENAVDLFIAYTENVNRTDVVEKADYVCNSFEQVYNQIYGPKS